MLITMIELKQKIAKLTSLNQDRVRTAQSLFGILPQKADIDISKDERLAAK